MDNKDIVDKRSGQPKGEGELADCTEQTETARGSV